MYLSSIPKESDLKEMSFSDDRCTVPWDEMSYGRKLWKNMEDSNIIEPLPLVEVHLHNGLNFQGEGRQCPRREICSKTYQHFYQVKKQHHGT